MTSNTIPEGFAYILYAGGESIDTLSDGGINPETKERVSATQYTAPDSSIVTYIAYKGLSSKDIYLTQSTTTPGATTWSGNKPIQVLSNGLSAPVSDKGPAAAIYNKTLFIAHKGYGEDTCIYITCMDLASGTWSADETISTLSAGLIDPQTSESPAMTVYQGKLYLFYRGNKEADIYVAWYDGRAWAGNKTIAELSNNQATPASSRGPSAAASDDYGLYYAFREDGGTDIALAAFDGETWKQQQTISALSHGSVDPETDDEPVIVLADSEPGIPDIYVYYRGKNIGSLWVTSFANSAWTNNRVAAPASLPPPLPDFTIQNTASGPAATFTPGAPSTGGTLCVIYPQGDALHVASIAGAHASNTSAAPVQ